MEAFLQTIGNFRQEVITGMTSRDQQMCCKRNFRGGHRPDMQIVNLRYTGQSSQVSTHSPYIDFRGYSMQRQVWVDIKIPAPVPVYGFSFETAAAVAQ